MVNYVRGFAILLVLWTLLTDVTSDYKAGVENAFIKHLEVATYDRRQLVRQHARIRRDLSETRALALDVQAFNSTYKLRLYPDNTVFANDVTFEGTRGPLSFDLGRAYRGVLEDAPEVDVKGLVTSEGLFDGSLTYPNGETIFIEPTSRYTHSTQESSHSVVYRSSDVSAPNMPPCASQNLHDKLAEDLSIRNPRRKRWSTRVPRAATIDPDKTTCMLYLQADHLFHQKFGSEEACIEVMTRHVQRVNSIYQGTGADINNVHIEVYCEPTGHFTKRTSQYQNFDQDGRTDSISFMIKRIKVHTNDALNESSYRFPGNYGVEKFLELFSEEDYDAFCLAYMFTYRDFEMGTLGLAWTGDLKNAGGVCEKNGHYRGSMKSLNTGIVTLLNYGKHVPPAVSHVTLAHEIGHNFGSPHDPETCTPGGEDGNFIMFARATSGDKRNNNKFSPCSLNAISPVLANKARSPRGCFTEPQAAICGNGVVEPGEECDCGWEQDCRDACCFPMSSQPRPGEPPCRLTPRSACSPSQGPCCTGECQLKFGDKCRDDNGCRDASYCDGRGPACPPSTNKPNKTVCNEEFVCFMGECTGSICLAYGLESCQCIPGPRDPPTKACELCCKAPGDDQPCMSSFDWNLPPFDIPDLYSKPGTPCNNYNGYCDVFQKCREVDPSGPLATLRKLLLSDESLASVRRWVGQHWYILLIAALILTVVLVMIARIFGKREDSKLRAVTILHTGNTEPVRLPANGAGGLTVHPAIRSRLPLGKRVRAKVSKKTNTPTVTATSPISVPPITTTQTPAEPARKQHKKRRRRRNKEVIDYSDKQPSTPSNAEDPLGKVRNWLLSSNPAPSIPPPANATTTTNIPKSKSTPAALQTPTSRASPAKSRNKSRSLGNLQAKAGARLQLLCRPPFKLTVKLRRNVREDNSTNKTAANTSKLPQQSSKQRSRSSPPNRGRTAILIRKEVRQTNRPNKHTHKSSEDVDVSTDTAVLISGAAVT